MKRRLVAMGRKVLIDQDVIMPMDLTGLVSRKYGDFAPYNIRLTDDGRVWILDQPSRCTLIPHPSGRCLLPLSSGAAVGALRAR